MSAGIRVGADHMMDKNKPSLRTRGFRGPFCGGTGRHLDSSSRKWVCLLQMAVYLLWERNLFSRLGTERHDGQARVRRRILSDLGSSCCRWDPLRGIGRRVHRVDVLVAGVSLHATCCGPVLHGNFRHLVVCNPQWSGAAGGNITGTPVAAGGEGRRGGVRRRSRSSFPEAGCGSATCSPTGRRPSVGRSPSRWR